MDFRVGDSVWIGSLQAEGTILSIDSKGWCNVQLYDDDSTYIPVHFKDLSFADEATDIGTIYQQIYTPTLPKSNIQRAMNDVVIPLAETTGIWIHIMPVYSGEKLDAFRMYLSDFGEDVFTFTFQLFQQQQSVFSLMRTQLPKRTHFHLYSCRLEDWKNSYIQLTFHLSATEEIYFDYQLSSKKIFNQLMSKEEAGSYAIFVASRLADLHKVKPIDDIKQASSAIPHKMQQHYEKKSRLTPPTARTGGEDSIDLHMEKLGVPSKIYNQWTAHEKKMFQLGCFEKKLLEARKKGISKLVVIHGVGSGNLKRACIEYLEKSKIAKSWVDEDSDFPLLLVGKMIVYL